MMDYRKMNVAKFEEICAMNWDCEASCCYELVRNVCSDIHSHMHREHAAPLYMDIVEQFLVMALMQYRDKITDRGYMQDYAHFCARIINECF